MKEYNVYFRDDKNKIHPINQILTDTHSKALNKASELFRTKQKLNPKAGYKSYFILPFN